MPTDEPNLFSDFDFYMKWHEDNPQLSRVVGAQVSPAFLQGGWRSGKPRLPPGWLALR